MGDRAKLLTPKLSQPASGEEISCLSFWYHLYGEDLDTLNLNMIWDEANLTLWTKFSTQGNIWKSAKVDIFPLFMESKIQVLWCGGVLWIKLKKYFLPV